MHLMRWCCLIAAATVCLTHGEVSAETGPTLKLSYGQGEDATNPVDAFMYFVPLTSPTSIVISTSSNTTLNATVTSWQTKQSGDKAFVSCDFKISGEGVYWAFYDPNEMIESFVKDKTNPKEYTKFLEWIRVSGACLGHIKAEGKVAGESVRMDYIEIQFNGKNTHSPVEVSIYDIPCVDGEYFYANRNNCRIARINSLIFKQSTSSTPRMSVELGSIKKAEGKEGFLSGLTAMIANMLSTSTPVSTVGNATMMEFGQALYAKQQAFTFPAASNFKLEL